MPLTARAVSTEALELVVSKDPIVYLPDCASLDGIFIFPAKSHGLACRSETLGQILLWGPKADAAIHSILKLSEASAKQEGLSAVKDSHQLFGQGGTAGALLPPGSDPFLQRIVPDSLEVWNSTRVKNVLARSLPGQSMQKKYFVFLLDM